MRLSVFDSFPPASSMDVAITGVSEEFVRFLLIRYCQKLLCHINSFAISVFITRYCLLDYTMWRHICVSIVTIIVMIFDTFHQTGAIEPITTTFAVATAIAGSAIFASYEKVKCSYYECCDNNWISYNHTGWDIRHVHWFTLILFQDLWIV